MANYKLPKNTEDDIINVTWKALKYAPYSQACICTIERKDNGYKQYILFSYNTAILSVWGNGSMFVTNDVNYSMTTARHVNCFCKEMHDLLGANITYMGCKLLMSRVVNIFTLETIKSYTRKEVWDMQRDCESLYWSCRRLNK